MATPGEEIEAERKARGLTRGAVAAAVGTNESTVYRIETGKVRNPSKIGLIQSYLRIGPYGDPPRENRTIVDVTRLEVDQLLRLAHEITSELGRRMDAQRPPPKRSTSSPRPASPPRPADISPDAVPLYNTEPPDIWGEDPAEPGQERREG